MVRTGRVVIAYLRFCEQVLAFGERVDIMPEEDESTMDYVSRQMHTYDERRGLR